MKCKEYLLSDLFDIKTTKSVDKNKIELKNDAPYAFIGRTPTNWGVQGFVDKLDFAPNPKDTFSLVQVGETVALWREKEWYASQNLFLLQPKLQKIKDVYLYFQTVINKEMSLYGKAYNSYPTIKSLNNTYISLPVKGIEEKIDWDYMESYMKAVMEESEKKIENLKKVDDTKNLIDTKDWKIFKLEDLFMISISLSVDKTAFEFDDSYDIDFIGRTSINNGIQGKLYELKYAPNEAGTYSVTQIGTKVCQYRENRWYASQNIFKLVPLDNAMNKASKFLTTVITQALKCTYSDDTYSSYPTLKSLRQQEIKLPVDDNGEPDWVSMEDYMKQIEQKAAKKLELFHKEKIV